MRPVRYNVAATLDGYIAGPHGEYDWIPHDQTVDFGALFANVDTVLLGRKTYDVVRAQGGELPWTSGSRVFVFSQTLTKADHPEVTIVADHPAETVAALRAEHGSGDIWLFGGGALFATLLAARQVDAVEVTVVPMLLGGGVPLLPEGSAPASLALTHTHVYPSGMVALHYAVTYDAPPGSLI